MAGPSQSKSSSSTDQSTKITETTTTTIGEIGLTGDAAVGIVESLVLGAVAQTKAVGDLIKPIVESQERLFGTPRGQERIKEIDSQAGNTQFKKNLPLILAGAGAIALIYGISK